MSSGSGVPSLPVITGGQYGGRGLTALVSADPAASLRASLVR